MSAPAVNTNANIAATAPAAPGSPLKQASFGGKSAANLQRSAGLNLHIEHLHDLPLIAGAADHILAQAFTSIIHDFARQLRSGTFNTINEKFDGSPAIAFGLDHHGQAFIAYKGGFDPKRGPQKLIRNQADLDKYYDATHGVYPTLLDCVNHLLPALNKHKSETVLRKFIFQADLLFTEANGARQEIDGALHIRPNTLKYLVNPEHAAFQAIAAAKVGLAVHTPCLRGINREKQRVTAKASSNHLAVRTISALLEAPDLFTVHPYHDRPAAKTSEPVRLADDLVKQCREVQLQLKVLSPEFSRQWRSTHVDQFRTFLNSSLRIPDGKGIFELAAKHQAFDPLVLLQTCLPWHQARLATKEAAAEPDVKVIREMRLYQEKLSDFIAKFEKELCALLQAYYKALRLQSVLQICLNESAPARLGGGATEGYCIERTLAPKNSEDGKIRLIAKIVERNEFTRKNNLNNRRNTAATDEQTIETARQLTYPLDVWRPGAVFWLGKTQPPHAGHIALLRAAQAQYGKENVFVLPSSKTANHRGMDWQETGFSKTQEAFRAGDFHYPFSIQLREDILKAGLGPDAAISCRPTNELRAYIKHAKEAGLSGRIYLLVGDKEIGAERYDAWQKEFPDHFGILPMPMQAEGISATQLRAVIKRYALTGQTEDLASLQAAYSFIEPAETRTRLLDRVIDEWRQAQAVLERTRGR